MSRTRIDGRLLDLRNGRIDLTHGAGGRATAQLVAELFAPHFDCGDNIWLRQGNDQAIMPPLDGRLAFSTDCHVVTPLFFPGGDILRGLKKPSDCKVFGTACTPAAPLGACMVSSEGACAAYYQYGRFLHKAPTDTLTSGERA